MTIGSAWDITDPDKPWAKWDPNANIKIPIGLTDWLAELGVGYGSHQIITAAPLTCPDPGTYSAGTILVRMALVASPVFAPGVKYPFTIRLTGDDGTTKDDRTLYLKVKER